jgi:hypothetical protein
MGSELILILVSDTASPAWCGLFCVAVIVAGIYAMVNKPASKKPAPKKTAAALVAPSHRSSA